MRSRGYVYNYWTPQRDHGRMKLDDGRLLFWANWHVVPGQHELFPLQIGDKCSFEVRADSKGRLYCHDIVVTEPYNGDSR